jgi:hypothetical protein
VYPNPDSKKCKSVSRKASVSKFVPQTWSQT